MSVNHRSHTELHTINAEKLLFYGTNKDATHITIASQDRRALDFENIDHVEMDDLRTLIISNQYTNTASIVLTDSDTIDFQSKQFSNLKPRGISAAAIASPNYAGQDLDHELDALATNIATKLNTSGYTANRMVITSGAGNITTGDAVSDYITTSSTSTLTNKTLTSPIIGDIEVDGSYLYIRNTETGSMGVSSLLAPGRALRIPMYCNNAQNNKDTFLTLIDNNSYDIFTSTDITQIGSNEYNAYSNGHILRFTDGNNWLNSKLKIGGTVGTASDVLHITGSNNTSLLIEADASITNDNANLKLKGCGTGIAQIEFTNRIIMHETLRGDGTIFDLYRDSNNDTYLWLGSNNTSNGVDRYNQIHFNRDGNKWISTGNNAGTGSNKGFMALGVETSGAASTNTCILIGVGKVSIGSSPTYPENYELEVNGDAQITTDLIVDGVIKANGNTIKGTSGVLEVDWLSTDGTTTTVSDHLAVVGTNSTFGSTSTDNTTVDIIASDTTRAELRCIGNSQGTGRVFVGQSGKWGGGIEYNGDNSPSSTGAGADYTAIFRRDNNTDSWTMKNYYSNNDWIFRGDIELDGGNIKEANGYPRITFDSSTPLTTITGDVDITANLQVGDTSTIYNNHTVGIYVWRDHVRLYGNDSDANETDNAQAANLYFDVNNGNSDSHNGIYWKTTYPGYSNTSARIEFNPEGGYFRGGLDFWTNNDGNNSSGGSRKVNIAGDGVIYTMNHLPLADNTYDLGSSSRRWDDIYATNSSIITTSDKRLKSDISNSKLGLDFINKLNPVSYRFNDKKRTHYGLIAQEVRDVLKSVGFDVSNNKCNDFAGYCYEFIEGKKQMPLEEDDGTGWTGNKIEETEDSDIYSLRYGEFISPMIKAIQELSKKHETLNADYQDLKMRFERDIKEEKDRNAELELRLSKMETMCVSIMTKIS